MNRQISFEEGRSFSSPFYIDLRSPKEYKEAHIPGALNLPVLNNEERQLVGLTYVQEDREKAKAMAVGFTSARLPSIYKKLMDLKEDHQVILYCSRGGYRSQVLFFLLQALREPIYKLDRGYKGYRAYVRKALAEALPNFSYVNLKGYTGCGKTEILQEIKNLGGQVLNLESLANHRGSSLGHVGLGDQPSQKMFESLLLESLQALDPARPVFVEGESVRIGAIQLPPDLYRRYSRSEDQVLIEAPLEERVARIRREYTAIEGFEGEVFAGLEKLSKYISAKRLAYYEDLLAKGDFDQIIEELIVKYYDRTYAIKDTSGQKMENLDSKATAKKLLVQYDKAAL